MKNIKVVNQNGTVINYESAVYLMDDELREELHRNIAECTEQEFFTAYEKLHTKRFDEEWELSKDNPIY